MSPVGGAAPTRLNLLRASRRLERVRRGAEILLRKRRALVRELLVHARDAVDAGERVERAAEPAYAALLRAEASHGHASLRVLGQPRREVDVQIGVVRTWGVEAAQILGRDPIRRQPAERGAAPGSLGPAAGAAAERFEQLSEFLLDTASGELLMHRLARALASTSRQVNLLERRVAPRLLAQVHHIRAALGEREREDHARLKQLLARRSRRGP
jgi:V/A-type H+-transporting ATPase subunit D